MKGYGPIKRVLISVSDKTGLAELGKYLQEAGKIKKMHKSYAKNYYDIAKGQYEEYRLEEANEVLLKLKRSEIRGAAVLKVR